MALITFGAFTDPHYADRDVRIGRYYRDGIHRMTAAQAEFSAAETDFNVCLGDFIDLCADDRDVSPALAEVVALTAQAGRPTYFVAGNHDLAALGYPALAKACAWPDEKGYYSFCLRGVRFIVLNTNFSGDSMELPHWNQTWLNTPQLAWLETELANPEPAVVLAHANLDPRMREDGELDPHIVRNAADARAILEASGKVRLVIQGHCHEGAYSEVNGITYLTLPAMVMGENKNAAAIFTVESDGSFTCRKLFRD
ncbi:MAG: metallophosphoesterase [Clostridia bacterium]|nr:metallophosphoesterase [Clostridia bacterium]